MRIFWRASRYWIFGTICLGLALVTQSAHAAGQSLAGATFAPSAIEVKVQAGQSITKTMTFTNHSTRSETFTARSGDLGVTKEGYLQALPQATSQWVLGQTVRLEPANFTLAPGAVQQVYFTLSVPPSLAADDYTGLLIVNVAGTPIKQEIGIPLLIHVTTEPVDPEQSLLITYNVDQPPILPPILKEVHAAVIAEAKRTAYEINQLISSRLALFGVRPKVTFRHLGEKTVDAKAIVEYEDWRGEEIAEQTVVATALTSGELRTVTVNSPPLVRSTRFGKIPYIGPAKISSHLPNENIGLSTTVFIIPWWAALVLLLASFGLFHRLLTLHPHFPHRPLRYQGRTSLSILLIFASLSLMPGGVTADVMTKETGPITIRASVAAYAGYSVTLDGDTMIVETLSNYYFQIQAGDTVYVVRPGDPPLRLPAGTTLFIMGLFGTT